MLSRRERVRALRIRRLQNQSLNTTNDQSDLDASYMPKKYDSPAKPNGYTFKEEKKEDDLPFDQTISHVVTPDSKTNSFFLKQDSSEGDVEIKDATFDEDDMNVDGSRSDVGTPNYAPSMSGSFGDEMTDIITTVVSQDAGAIMDSTFKEDDVSIVTPHYDIEDSDSDGDSRHFEYVKAGANQVREKILAGFSLSDDQQSHTSISAASTDNSEKYGSSLMDELDLQLIEVRRPNGVEYGDEEVSL
jgi:hypothetical protein